MRHEATQPLDPWRAGMLRTATATSSCEWTWVLALGALAGGVVLVAYRGISRSWPTPPLGGGHRPGGPARRGRLTAELRLIFWRPRRHPAI